jgi:hypothetical protein
MGHDVAWKSLENIVTGLPIELIMQFEKLVDELKYPKPNAARAHLQLPALTERSCSLLLGW